MCGRVSVYVCAWGFIVITICFSMSKKKAKSPTTSSKLRLCALSFSLSLYLPLCLPFLLVSGRFHQCVYVSACAYYKRLCVQMSLHSSTLQKFLPLLLCYFILFILTLPAAHSCLFPYPSPPLHTTLCAPLVAP